MWKYFLHKIKQKLPTDKVTKIRLSLATIYAFSAWNLVIIIFYQSIKKDIPTTAESSTYYKFNNLNYIFNYYYICCTHILHSINLKSLQKKNS